MDKTSQKVTEDRKRQERGKKSHQTYMKRLKEKILEDNQDNTTPSDSSPTGDRTPSIFSSTGDPTASTSSSMGDPTPSFPLCTTRSNDLKTYVYGIGILAVLPIDVCLFFAYNNNPQEKYTNEEKQDQPPKRRHML